MEGRRLVALVFAALVIVAAIVFWLLPEVDERLRPEPRAAWVGVEIAGSGVARVGRVELAAGDVFRLHAILEAESQSGETVYFTDAAAVDFGEGAITEGVRTWNGIELVRVLWLTLEGAIPFLQLPPERGLDGFRFEEFLHPEWGRGWTAAGSLEGRNDDQLADEDPRQRWFGTQHYRAWIELYEDDKALVPASRFKSPGFEELVSAPDAFPSVVAELAPPLQAPSRVFGLTQVELSEGAPPGALERLAELYRDGLAFSRLLVLRSILQSVGGSLEDLGWQRLDLAAGAPWGEAAEPGDLLRVGARWVVLFEDSETRGAPGVLDPEDVCMDFDRGAELRPLSEVFVGGGDVEWASLAGAP